MAMRSIRWLAACMSILLAACASAPDRAAPPSPAEPAALPGPDPEAIEQVPLVEEARNSVRDFAVWLARGVDSWFGDRPFEDGGKVTDGRLGLSLLTRQGDSPSFNLRFNARFHLPNVQQRTYLFLGRDDPREVITDKPAALSREEQLLPVNVRERAFFAGVGRTLTDRFDVRLGLRGGLKLYAQARYSHEWLITPHDLIGVRETVFWTAADRIGSTSAVSYDHAVAPAVVLRWLNSATITQESPKFAWSSLLGIYRSFAAQKILSLEAVVNGQQGSGLGASDYGLQTRWEQPIHEDWLLGGIVVGHFWPRSDVLSERRRAWALGLSLKLRF